jgi:hypothetical protein
MAPFRSSFGEVFRRCAETRERSRREEKEMLDDGALVVLDLGADGD